MNDLTIIRSLGKEKNSALSSLVYSAIDSKIDFIEMKTRRLLANLSHTTEKVEGSHRSDYVQSLPSMTHLSVNNADNTAVFEYLEQLSRSVTILENMKFSVCEANAKSIMQLLDDDRFMQCNDQQLNQVLGGM